MTKTKQEILKILVNIEYDIREGIDNEQILDDLEMVRYWVEEQDET